MLEILAYAMFIIIMAIPYLVIALIMPVFFSGIIGLITGILRHRFSPALFGVPPC
jgi:hypothetical protein